MSLKRSVTNAGVPEIGGSSSKRRRVSADGQFADGTEAATKVGLRFLNQLKVSKDKSGRDVAPQFLTLPSRGLTEYYRMIKMPIAIDTVESRLQNREYSTISHVESDLKRMVQNAKDFNDKNSTIFADAERIRKMLSNFMVKNNPAYDDPNYAAVPTPIPGELGGPFQSSSSSSLGNTDQVSFERARSAGRANSRRLTPKSLNGGASPAGDMDGDMLGDFKQDTFQSAQEKIMRELLTIQNEEGLLTFSDFINYPPRSLKDYYQTIKHPISMKAIEKKVQGQEGRSEATGVSIFKSWAAFEDEVSLIWQNAREYNEDGSPIFLLAGELEALFNQRFADATRLVPEPTSNGETSGPRLKLNMKTPEPTARLKLRLGGKSEQQSNDESLVQVDSEALRRQRELVNAGANGRGVSGAETVSSRPGARNPFSGSTSSAGPNALPTLAQLGQDGNRSASVASPALSASAIKSEVPPGQSPPNTIQPRKDSLISDEAAPSPQLPPVSNMPPPSGNSHPGQAEPPARSLYGLSHQPTSPIESILRQPGKGDTSSRPSMMKVIDDRMVDASSALILKTEIFTHPDIKVDQQYRFTVLPLAKYSQQKMSIHLPPSHYKLRIIPTVAPVASNRQYKLVVSQNYNPLMPKDDRTDPSRPIYDLDMRMKPGLTEINVEMIAGLPRGAPGRTPGQDLELERITLLVNLMRH